MATKTPSKEAWDAVAPICNGHHAECRCQHCTEAAHLLDTMMLKRQIAEAKMRSLIYQDFGSRVRVDDLERQLQERGER